MRFLLLSSILLCLFAVSTYAQKKRPIKRKPAAPIFTVKGDKTGPPAPPPVKKEPTNVGTTFDKYVSSYDLNADGTATETREQQRRCTNEVCLESLGQYKLTYNENLQKVRALDAYVLKADGTKIKVPPAGFVDQPTDQAEAAPGFSSLRELVVKFDGPLKVGDAVYNKIEIVTIKPSFDGKQDGLELFPVLFEWKSIEINISAPVSYPIFFDQGTFEGGKVGEENGRAKWQFRKQNISSIDVEPVMQSVIEISPHFAFTAFRSMDELGSIFWNGINSKAVVTPEIQSLADEITKDASSPSEKASAIYGWVNKNIRYLSIILDRGGWIPHSSTEIIKNGYGDCKDYTTIIHTLLKAKGIDSIPVLIRADMGSWFPSVATAEYFNHVILYIPSLNLFADATTPNTRLGLIPQQLVGKRGVLSGERTGVIDLPKDEPADNQMVSVVNVDFAENGNLKARTRNVYIGRSEMVFRPMFASSVVRNSDELVKMILAYHGLQGYGKIISVSNPHDVGEQFGVELEANIDNYTTFLPAGKLDLPAGLNMMSLTSLGMFTTTESRKSYIIIGASKFSEKVTINLPATVRATSAPVPVNFTNSVGSFKIVPNLVDGVVTFTRELIFFKDTVEPKDYPSLKELVNKMLETYSVEIGYTADPSLLRAKSKELRAAPVKRRAPASFAEILKSDIKTDPTGLKPLEVSALEKKLVANENDIETRIRLIRHYADESSKKPALQALHVRHRIWLIKNRPLLDDDAVYGWSFHTLTDSSREQLKAAWLEEVEAAKLSPTIRLNAASSLQSHYPEIAAKLFDEGAKLDPSNYIFPLRLTEVEISRMEHETAAEKKLVIGKAVVEHGRTALALIKKERSSERDSDRKKLLLMLCPVAVDVDDLDAASAFARELILDFGQSSDDYSYDEAVHNGNITLGEVELKLKRIEKASQYLLIAIRAPLRSKDSSLFELDMRLARELFEKGEKNAVLEYLTLCLQLTSRKDAEEYYDEEKIALTLWKDQIGKGIKPSFDFENP